LTARNGSNPSRTGRKENDEGYLMDDSKFLDTLFNMDPALRKDLLDRLVASLLSGLNEAEKKDVLQTVLSGRKKNKHLIDMVEY